MKPGQCSRSDVSRRLTARPRGWLELSKSNRILSDLTLQKSVRRIERDSVQLTSLVFPLIITLKREPKINARKISHTELSVMTNTLDRQGI